MFELTNYWCFPNCMWSGCEPYCAGMWKASV